jgi:hypothetical protein
MGEGVSYPFLDFPSIIDITLYKNNYYDNLIITKLKRNVMYESPPELNDVYVVSAEDLKNTLYTSFIKEIDAVRSLPLSDIQRRATSLFFLDKILSNYKYLRYVKINVSNEENYSRLNKNEKIPSIFFNYKINMLSINLTEIFSTSDVKEINHFLINSGIVVHDDFLGYDHRIYIRTSEMISLLINSPVKEKGADLLLSIIDNKSENDNPLIMLITDFDI